MASLGTITVELSGDGLTQLDRIEAKLDQVLARLGGESPHPGPDPEGGNPPEPPPTDPNPTPAGRHPSDVLPVLADWTIMLPTGTDGDPDNGYLVGKSIPDTYFVGADAGVVFRCHPGTAVHSKGSKYGRCEARQMVPGRRWVKSAWPSSAPHRLTAMLRIDDTHLTHKIVNCVQIHDGSDDVIQVQLADGVLGVRHQDGKAWEVLDSNYRGGTFHVAVDVTGDGRILVDYNGGHDKRVSIPKTGSGWYWKVGAYPNVGGANPQRPEVSAAYCDVIVYELAVTPA